MDFKAKLKKELWSRVCCRLFYYYFLFWSKEKSKLCHDPVCKYICTSDWVEFFSFLIIVWLCRSWKYAFLCIWVFGVFLFLFWGGWCFLHCVCCRFGYCESMWKEKRKEVDGFNLLSLDVVALWLVCWLVHSLLQLFDIVVNLFWCILFMLLYKLDAKESSDWIIFLVACFFGD